MHYLLFYEVGEDYIPRRAEFRNAHLEMAWKASERGELQLAGALAGRIDQGQYSLSEALSIAETKATRLMSPKSLPGATPMLRTGS